MTDITTTSMDRPVVDGFSYNMSLQPGLPYRYSGFALGQIEKIRKAKGLRPKWYVFPDQISATPVIPGYGSVEQQFRIKPGGYILGYKMSGVLVDPAIGTTNLVQYRLYEQAPGMPVTDNFTDSAFMGDTTRGLYPGQAYILQEPRLVTDPGWWTLEIANTSQFDITLMSWLQFTMLVAEPVELVEDISGGAAC